MPESRRDCRILTCGAEAGGRQIGNHSSRPVAMTVVPAGNEQRASGAAPADEATLQQGLPLLAETGAAGQFWTFTMSNSEAFSEVLVGEA